MTKKETYKFQYEKWHTDTKESREWDIADSREFINIHGLWPEKKNAKIFDVGCGMGRLLLAFREGGYKSLSGVDIDDYQISIAKKEKLDVQLMDARDFFKKSKTSFNLVTMVDCLEHVATDKQIGLLSDIYKGLNVDGRLVLRVPNALAPAFGYFRYIDFTHKVSYTEISLNYVLKNAGFEYVIFRPAWRETDDIVQRKVHYADLLKAEFAINNPILTANMVAIAFKSKEAFDSYARTAPDITIKYEDKKKWWKTLLSH